MPFDVTPVTIANGGTGSTSASAARSALGLGNVENTALSTWIGSSSIATLGTITVGTWQGTAIADSFISSAATWNGKQNALGFTPLNQIGQDLTGSDGSGFLGYPTQSAKPATPGSGFRFYADTTNRLSWIGTNGFIRTFDGTANTADRAYVLPDVAGMIITTGNLSAAAGTTASTLTIGNDLRLVEYDLPTGRWLSIGTGRGAAGDQSNINGLFGLQPFLLTAPKTLSGVAIRIGTTGTGSAGAVVRIGIYKADAMGQPSTLISDLGTVAATGAAGTVVALTGLSIALTGGLYWIGGVVQGAPATLPYLVTSVAVGGPYSINFGELPATPTSISFDSRNYPALTGITGALPSPMALQSFGWNTASQTPIRIVFRFS